MFLIRKWHIFLILLCASLYVSAENKVTIAAAQKIEGEGRLHLVFSSSGEREPRFYSAWPVKGIEPLFSIDLEGFSADQRVVIDDKVSGFPYQSLNSIPEGEWFVQAIFDNNFLDSNINSPKNYYSEVIKFKKDKDKPMNIKLHLSHQIDHEQSPADSQFLKFVKMRSQKLSMFWHADMDLRAGVILPKTYYDNPLKEFPVIFNVGGYHAKYDRAQRLFDNKEFNAYWFADDTPQMVMVFLDGDGPLGDPYQIDSANNGPYGQATWEEFLPFLTRTFNLTDSGSSRFVTGCSTGGWVSLALQLYYPDTFNGAWSFSADGVDFKYFQLVDIYNDDNAFINEHGVERPSYRAKDGEIIFTIQREIMMENQIGRHNSYAYSGGQWGGWNAVFGPKLDNGEPSTIWDPNTGKIDKTIAQQWKKYDLRQYTQDNWTTLGPKLTGKLHIWMGDMDNFYLNNAMHLYQDMLSNQSEPVSDATFTWTRGAGHCDYDRIPMLKKMMGEMQQRVPK